MWRAWKQGAGGWPFNGPWCFLVKLACEVAARTASDWPSIKNNVSRLYATIFDQVIICSTDVCIEMLFTWRYCRTTTWRRCTKRRRISIWKSIPRLVVGKNIDMKNFAQIGQKANQHPKILCVAMAVQYSVYCILAVEIQCWYCRSFWCI